MNKWLVRLLLIYASLGISNVALAQGTGPYVEGSLGWGKVNLKGGGSNTGLAGGGAIGYEFYENIGLEINAYFFSKVKEATRDNRVYSLALKGTLPVSPEVDFFGKAGVGMAHIKSTRTQLIDGHLLNDGDTENKFTGFFALGAQYNVSDHVGIHVQGITTTTNAPVPAMFGVLGGLTLLF